MTPRLVRLEAIIECSCDGCPGPSLRCFGCIAKRRVSIKHLRVTREPVE